MKKTAIALLAFAAALFAVSCQKESNPAQNVSGPMTISAVSEGLNTPTKTELAFKYDVLWRSTDKIYVVDGQGHHDTFSLKGGAGTTKGTFKQDGQVTFTGEVQAYYPETMLEGGSPVWPASQTNDQTIPMYCKKTLSGEAEERMDFISLGSVLQIVFNTTQENVTLKSIEIKDGSATLSGAFTVDTDGKAVITASDKAGITLDLGTGVALGKAANYFNIAVPAGNYQDLTLVFTATDGTKCTMTKGKVNIAYNAVGRLTLMGEKFKADVPADALPGVFTVADDGQGNVKKVHFSKGNLYYDGSNWGFEEEQYYFRTYDGKDKCDADGYSWGSGTTSGHWGLFGWSTDKTNYGMSTSTSSGDYSGNFRDWGTAIDSKGTWSTLTGGDNGEWKYLFDHHVNVWGMCNEVMYGRFIAPDGFVGDASALSKAINDWESAQAAGIVFLPACGYRNGASVDQVESKGLYWSSTTAPDERAYYVSFLSNQANFGYCDYRNVGLSVRLVTDASVTPAPTPTTTGTAKATIGGSEVDVNWVQLWAGGPKFADRNVGASSATDIGELMKFTNATKAGAEYVWGANWCTPSKDQMDELQKAATSTGSEKVKCEYTQVSGIYYGFKFTGKEAGYTGNSLIFPADGSKNSGSASWWSDTADSEGKPWFMCLNYEYGNLISNWYVADKSSRTYYVRPVLNN